MKMEPPASTMVVMPVGTDVSCEDMFADESDFEFDMEKEPAGEALAETSRAADNPAAEATARPGHTSIAQVEQSLL
jgi:hypothetical protein